MKKTPKNSILFFLGKPVGGYNFSGNPGADKSEGEIKLSPFQQFSTKKEEEAETAAGRKMEEGKKLKIALE